MNSKLFYTIPALYTLSIYIAVILVSFVQDSQVAHFFTYIPLVAILLAVVACIYGYRRFDSEVFLNSAVMVKCALIPFFLLGGIVVAISALLTFVPVPFFFMLMPIVALAFSFMGWLAMLGGSAFTITYLLKLKEEGGCSTSFVVANSILQIFFVADVVDTMAVAWRVGSWRRLSIALLIIFAILFVAFIVAVLVAGIALYAVSNGGI